MNRREGRKDRRNEQEGRQEGKDKGTKENIFLVKRKKQRHA